MTLLPRIVAGLLGLVFCAGAAMAQEQPPPADPLTAQVDVRDVERFIALWRKTNGHPTAAQIETDYLHGGGPGVQGFTKQRQLSGANIAEAIEEHHDWYERAIDKCLPWVADSAPDLRSIYLGLQGLLPEKPLPQIYMAFGRANSGGTAVPGAQLLGLETICHVFGSTPGSFRQAMRTFFAHETAHTFQGGDFDANPRVATDALLSLILQEGGPDYVASLVTGAPPNPDREVYGRAHEAELWKQFAKDRAIANAHFKGGFDKAGNEAEAHWLYNAQRGKLPGWETDMGYWLGMQIIKAYVERSADPHAAIREALALQDPAEILRKSGYADKFR
jgi:hypothetical protein